MKFSVTAVITLCIVAGGHGKEGFGSGEQEWGYVRVRPHTNMFWWLYYTTANVTSYYDKPLIIWLQGGPGLSSTGFGNFEHLGPLDIFLEERNHTWVKDYNVLLIDNPVGSGFSYVEKLSSFVTNNAQIAEDLLECIRGFYLKLPAFANVPVYIAAQSYGGKMAAEFAHVWHQAKEAGTIQGNLKGLAMMASWISPIDSVLAWPSYLLNTGLVDTNGYKKIEAFVEITRTAIEGNRWSEATFYCSNTEQLITNITDDVDFYNILYKQAPLSGSAVDRDSHSSDDANDLPLSVDRDEVLEKLMNGVVKKKLGLNVTWGLQRREVMYNLVNDLMKSTTSEVEYLLNNTDINVFVLTGQLDLIVNTPGIVAWVEKLKWPNATNWLSSPRRSLVVNNVIEGYVKKYNNLAMYWINRSGHRIPIDNPKATAAVLEDLTSNAYT